MENGETGPASLPLCPIHPPLSPPSADVSPVTPAQETLGHFPQVPSQASSLIGGYGKEEEEKYFHSSQLPTTP